MNTWKGYIQYNGEEVSIFREVDFKVTDELYVKIQEAIKNDVPFEECDFYNELISEAEGAFDLAAHLGFYNEAPLKEDYKNEEEYMTALKEYEEEKDDYLDKYCLVSVNVYDPIKEKQFTERFIGKTFEGNEDRSREITLYENGSRFVTYRLDVWFDEKSTLTDITDIRAEGLESVTMKYTSTGDAYPDYELLAVLLTKELESSDSI